jgi:hypothetical protein
VVDLARLANNFDFFVVAVVAVDEESEELDRSIKSVNHYSML